MRCRSWVMVKGTHHHGHPSPSLCVWWGAAHCPCMGGCGHSCVSMCAHHGRALLIVDGLVVGLVLVYVLWTVVVMCG